MDIATIVGIISAFSLVISAIFMGGDLILFIDINSFLIVCGGTFGVTLVNYPLADIIGVGSVIKHVITNKVTLTGEVIEKLVAFSQKVRKEGFFALEDELTKIEDSFMAKGIQLAIDGHEPVVIENILNRELEYIEERHKLGSEIFQTMGTFAPAMGMVGTLIGLIQMLQTMDDAASIGPAMAVALITTFYGAVLANMLFLPIAGKLKTRSNQELLQKGLILEGILSIQAGDNPRIVEQKLHSFIAPKMRENVFDKLRAKERQARGGG